MNPRSPIEPEGTFAGLRGGPIVLGALVDIALTVVASTAVLLFFAPEVFSSDEATARQAVGELQASSPAFAGANVVVGALATVLGAFLGAHRAGRLHVRHGGWIAVTSTVIGTFLALLDPSTIDPASDPPIWAQVAGWLLILPSGIAGGALAAWLQRHGRT